MKAAFERARKALDFLEYHRLDPSPTHYDLALRYVTAPGSELARDVVARTEGGLRLTTDAMAALIERHGIPATGSAIAQRERTVARQTEELGTLTSDAHDITHALGRDVGAIVQRGHAPSADAGGLLARLSDAERELIDLRQEFAKLREDITHSADRQPDTDRDQMTQGLNQDGARHILAQLAEHNRTYVMLLFSIDDLVGINARFGPAVGDNVINAFTATLRQAFPDEDLIRWTGNEFIIIATQIAVAPARQCGEDALAAFRARRLRLRGTGEWIGTVTASGGIIVGQGEMHREVMERVRANRVEATVQGGDRIYG